MTDLQLAAGFLNASRNANQARLAAERHLEEARSAVRYAQEAAEAARDGAQAEQERLALEKERFAAEQRERSLRAQAQTQQQQARELLADALAECSVFADAGAPTGTPESLLHQLAGLQVKVLILEGDRQALSELTDKTALRQLRQQVVVCVRGFADRGLCPADPWAVVSAEIERMRVFEARGSKLTGAALQTANKTLRPTNATLSHDDWQALWKRLQDCRSQWPAQLSEMNGLAPAVWWDGGGNALTPEWQGLLMLEALIPTGNGPEDKATAPEDTIKSLAGWLEFTRGRGYLHGKIQTALDRSHESLTALNEQYLADLPRWGATLELAEAGNYQQAEKALVVCHNRVVGAEHRRCVDAINGWKTGLRDLAGAPLPQELQRQAALPWPLLPWAFRAAVRQRRESVGAARNWLKSKEGTAAPKTKTDFSRQSAATLAAHARTVDWAEGKTKRAVLGRWSLEVVVAVAVAAAAVMMWLTSMQEARNESERADIQRQSAEIAARRGARAAEEKRQADAARLVTDAEQKLKDQADREARTQADQQHAQEAEQQRRQEAARQQRQADEQAQQQQKDYERSAEHARAAQSERDRQSAEEQRSLAKARENYAREEHRRALLEVRGSNGSVKICGTIALDLQLTHGFITMRAGAQYGILDENQDGTFQVCPVDWTHEGVLHSDYYNSGNVWTIEGELRRGMRVKAEYLTTAESK